jgi:hypothetical protein
MEKIGKRPVRPQVSEVLCTDGRNIKSDINWLLHSIFVRYYEIASLGNNADAGHINRLIEEAVILKRCQDKCEGKKAAARTRS